MKLYGLDGARGSWAVCELSDLGARFFKASFDGLERELEKTGRFFAVVDTPIGLIAPADPNASGDRPCDKAARRLIVTGGVFTPPRADRPEPVSAQTKNILPYMQAAHRLFRAHPGRVLESHPEVIWPFLGAPGDFRKKTTDEGFEARAELIRKHLRIDIASELLRQNAHPPGRRPGTLRKRGRDDWADAAAMAIVARTWATLGDDLAVLYDPPHPDGRVLTRRLGDVPDWIQTGCLMALT